MKFRVIAVDDQPDNLLVLEHYLGNDYALTTFRRGQELIDYFAAGGQADLILLDIVMPMPDGYSLCRWLKAAPLTRDVPVVFLTSLESHTDEAFALSLGAEDFIHKPLSPPVVLARVRNHLLLSQTRQALQKQNQTLEILVAERTRKNQGAVGRTRRSLGTIDRGAERDHFGVLFAGRSARQRNRQPISGAPSITCWRSANSSASTRRLPPN